MTDIMKPKFEFDPETMVTKITGPSTEQIKKRIMDQFIQDQEGRTQQALIELGWSPPLAENEKTGAKYMGQPVDEMSRASLAHLVVRLGRDFAERFKN